MKFLTDKQLNSNKKIIIEIILKLAITSFKSEEELSRYLFKKAGEADIGIFSKSQLISAYRKFKASGDIKLSEDQEKLVNFSLRRKKVRTLSGVTPVTVLTEAYYCPGNCIFCPSESKMPKSYLSKEPGAQRAKNNKFDPYLQTFNRLVALYETGHSTDKVELIILGGTWTAYPNGYRIWFIKRCFDALNEFAPLQTPEYLAASNRRAVEKIGSWQELHAAHRKNETAKTRCVGLSVETRPDYVSVKEAIGMRRLGVTKVQIGVQSLNDKVLRLNCRGHTAAQTKKAFTLLRSFGFKIQAHWMANLYGSSPKRDVIDFKKLFRLQNFRPDELKIYPCSLLTKTRLFEYYKKGLWTPYSYTELLSVITGVLPATPRYCRITRIFRDIPSEYIIEGVRNSNFRQLAETKLQSLGVRCIDIRSREIRNAKISWETLKLKKTRYKTANTTELFLEYITPKDELVGFLRLSLPQKKNTFPELANSAIIREVHVYGEALEMGVEYSGKAQHAGIGKNLINLAKKLAYKKGYKDLAVISSVGTREYYKRLGFYMGALYQHLSLV